MRKKLRIMMLTAAIIVNLCLIFPAFFSSNEIVERKYKDNITPIITMEDLKFDNSVTEESSINVLMSGNNRIGVVYNLYMNASQNDETLGVDINVYLLNEAEDTNVYTKKIISNKYTAVKSKESTCTGSRCHFPNVDYDTAVKNMYKLDWSEWNVNSVYSMYDLNSSNDNTNNYIFIQDDNKVIILRVSNNILLTSDNIKILNTSFNTIQKELESELGGLK